MWACLLLLLCKAPVITRISSFQQQQKQEKQLENVVVRRQAPRPETSSDTAAN